MLNLSFKTLLIAPLLLGMVCTGWAEPSKGRYHAVRLKPGQDLKVELTQYLREQNIRACALVTCVGSLTEARIRYADRAESSLVPGPLEIVSLVGCGGLGKWHLHLSVSDSQGRTLGGHLLDGNIVRTTAEIVLVELEELEFDRVHDPETGYQELEVRTRSRRSTGDAE